MKTKCLNAGTAIFTFLALVVLTTPLHALPQDANLAQAQKMLAESKWNEALLAFQKLSTADPSNGSAWTGLGEASLQTKSFSEARAAFQRAINLKFTPVLNEVNIARTFASEGNKELVIQQLRKLVASGQEGRARPFVAGSSEFSWLLGDKEFQKFLNEEMAACRSAQYRKFDFWVGDWTVKSPTGQIMGSNTVSREQDGCLIMEHWKDASGFQTGISFNYFDVRDSLWHQLYLDNSGNAGAFPAMSGDLTPDGKMVLISNPNAPTVFRWTWYVLSPGKVRQMAEQSADRQKTWTITFDSVYEKN